MNTEIIIFGLSVIIAIALLWSLLYREIHILSEEVKVVHYNTVTNNKKLKKLTDQTPFEIYLAKDDFGEYAFFSMPTWSDARSRWVCSDNHNYLELSHMEIQRIIGRKLTIQECIQYTI